MSAVHIGETIRDRYPHVATERGGLVYPDLENGIPLDRTICPYCLGLESYGASCHVCHGKAVCPTCRNGRVVSVDGPRLTYRTCPDCTEPMTDDSGQTLRTETGVPRWYWHASKQQEAIRRYRLTRWQERDAAMTDDEEVPFYGTQRQWDISK